MFLEEWRRALLLVRRRVRVAAEKKSLEKIKIRRQHGWFEPVSEGITRHFFGGISGSPIYYPVYRELFRFLLKHKNTIHQRSPSLVEVPSPSLVKVVHM